MLSRRKFLVAAGVGLAAGAAGVVVDRRSGVERDGTRTLSLWTLEAPPIPRAPRLAGTAKWTSRSWVVATRDSPAGIT